MNQLFEDGKVINVDGVDLECVAVAYVEDSEGVKSGFSYNFRAKSEVDAEREAEAKRLQELADLELAAEADPVEQPTEPEIKEETQYVR